MGYGTAAARASFTPSPPTPASGAGQLYVWYETDTGNTYAYHGGTWSLLSATPGMALISEQVTAGSATNVTFSSISSSYRDLIVRVRGRSQASAAVDSVLLQFNSDTGANYDYQFWQAFGTTVSAASSFGQTSLSVGQLAGATATANFAGAVDGAIYDYRGTTFDKQLVGSSGVASATSGNGTARMSVEGNWRSTSAINAIKVFLGTGPFVNGSIVSLYGSL
jgi:hypothetical protein